MLPSYDYMRYTSEWLTFQNISCYRCRKDSYIYSFIYFLGIIPQFPDWPFSSHGKASCQNYELQSILYLTDIIHFILNKQITFFRVGVYCNRSQMTSQRDYSQVCNSNLKNRILFAIDIICTGVRPASSLRSYQVSGVSEKGLTLFLLH